MSKNKNRKNVTEEVNNEQNLPAQQEDSTNYELSNKEENEMELKEVKKNALQKIGEAITNLGDKKAAYKEEHPVASKVKTGVKIGLGVGAAGLAIVGAVVHHNKKKDDVVDTYVDDDTFDDFDDEDVFEDDTENVVDTDTVESDVQTNEEV